MRRAQGRTTGHRGATLAFVAVSLAAMLGMSALAIDMGMLYKKKGDAQRAADAAALAGASAYRFAKPTDVVDLAWQRALEYAGKNTIGHDTISIADTTVWVSGDTTFADFPQGQVQVIPAVEKVRVIVFKDEVSTFFGRIFGMDAVGISALAAAEAATSGSGKCVKPFAIPDWWSDADNDNDPTNRLEDLGKGQGKGGETWAYKSNASDYYRRWSDDTPGETRAFTGLGSSFRNSSVYKDDQKTGKKFWDDYGRPVVLKKPNPQQTMAPSFFQPWVLPGSKPGAKDYRANIATCSSAEVNLNQEYTADVTADTSSYENKPGNMIGPTKQGMDSLISLDPKACWAEFPDPNHSGWMSGEVRQLDGAGNCTQAYPAWESSPRVILVPMFDPALGGNGKSTLKFNNIGLLFVENQKSRHEPVIGRFMYFAKGSKESTTKGPLIKIIRLVE